MTNTRSSQLGRYARNMPPGTRVALYKSPWPEREGLVGTVVAPPADGTYPQPAPWELVVLLDDDPLGDFTCIGVTHRRSDQTWSCVIGRRNLKILEIPPS